MFIFSIRCLRYIVLGLTAKVKCIKIKKEEKKAREKLKTDGEHI